MISYEEFREDVRRRKRERWAAILASEPPGRPAGRRPRDPEQEAMLLALDRARLARRQSLEQGATDGRDAASPAPRSPARA